MTLEQLLERVPIEILPARAPVEPLAPEPPDEPIEPPQTAQIRRSPEVLVVPSEFGIEHRGLILNRVVPMVLAPLRHRLHTTPKTLANGPDVNREPPPPAARTDVRIAEKIEGRGLRRLGSARKRRTAERQEPRLLGVERQPILCKPLGKNLQNPLRILPILKAENEIIGVPNFGGLAAQARFYLVLEPLIEQVGRDESWRL